MKKSSLTLLSLTIGSLFFVQAQKTDHSLLKELKKEISNNTYPNIDAIIMEVGDEIIVEEYFNGFGKDSLHDTRSSFKSITSLLAGIAIDQQLIALDDKLGQFFPELIEEEKKYISVQNLLEMRSGLNCEEFYDMGPECENDMWESDDWIAYCLSINVKSPPGLNWSYSSNDPMIMGEIISRASGMTIMDFARKNLFSPLGIEEYRWTISPKGRGMTAGSFFMKPIDMLKIARLVDNKGQWNGKEIVSEAWISSSTYCKIDLDFSFTRYSNMQDARYESAFYGFYWYREHLRYKDIDTEVLFASGNGGQYMMLLPDYQTKVVFTGSNYGNWRGKLPFEILLKYLIPIIENEYPSLKKKNNMKLGAFSVSLSVKDLTVSKEFYETLGFEVLAGSFEQNYLIMKNENALIGLFQGMFEGNILTFNPGWDENGQNIEAFDDVRAIQKHLKSKEISLLTEADESTAGPASIMVTDPDGNVILLDQHR